MSLVAAASIVLRTPRNQHAPSHQDLAWLASEVHQSAACGYRIARMEAGMCKCDEDAGSVAAISVLG